VAIDDRVHQQIREVNRGLANEEEVNEDMIGRVIAHNNSEEVVTADIEEVVVVDGEEVVVVDHRKWPSSTTMKLSSSSTTTSLLLIRKQDLVVGEKI
jgi:hypothetical protein